MNIPPRGVQTHLDYIVVSYSGNYTIPMGISSWTFQAPRGQRRGLWHPQHLAHNRCSKILFNLRMCAYRKHFQPELMVQMSKDKHCPPHYHVWGKSVCEFWDSLVHLLLNGMDKHTHKESPPPTTNIKKRSSPWCYLSKIPLASCWKSPFNITASGDLIMEF